MCFQKELWKAESSCASKGKYWLSWAWLGAGSKELKGGRLTRVPYRMSALLVPLTQEIRTSSHRDDCNREGWQGSALTILTLSKEVGRGFATCSIGTGMLHLCAWGVVLLKFYQ